jgi:PAS domain S-box-containing protein
VRTDEEARAESGYRSLFQRIPVPLYRTTPEGVALAVNSAMVEILRYPDAESLLQVPVQDLYVDAGERERFRLALAADGWVVGFEYRLRRRDGSVIWVRDSARAVTDEDGAVMYVEGSMIDVTDEKNAQEQLRQQAKELSVLQDITVGLIEELDVTGLLESILARAAELLDTDHAYLYVVDGGELVVRAGTGLFVDWLGYRLRRGEGLAGRVLATGEPYAVDDYQAWEGRRPEFDFIRAAAALPLRSGNEVVGVIGLIRTEEGREFTALEMGLVSRFARMASLVLNNARLYDAAQREIGERRRAQEELRSSEFRYRSLFEGNPVPMWVFDTETLRFLDVNDAAVAHYGYTRDEFLSMTLGDVRDPPDVPQLIRDEDRSERPLHPTRKWRHRKKDGSLIDIEVSSHAVQWEGRKARLAMITDVTERNRAEEALRKSEHRYRTLVEATSEWIWSIDLEGRHTSSNPAIREILGYEPDELIGQSSFDLIHPDDRRDVEGWLPRAMAEKRGWTGVLIRWRHRDGSYRWLESNGIPLLDESGELAGYWGADRDVTERVRGEQERRRLLAELVRVQEEERRRIANEIHDDPVQAMTAVEMRLESLRRRIGEGEERRTLEQLSASVSSAIARLRRLLVELRPPRLDREGLAPAIRSLLDRLRAETGIDADLEDRSIREIPPGTRTVVYRIAQEALTNVRKHADARSARVIVDERDGGILIRVRDDGRGFEPDRGAEEPGHLGLVSMRERAELAGGRFRVTSTLGAGTTVEAWVPREESDG